MKSTISFDLVSPEKLLFNDEVGMIIVPGKDGDIGVLPDHSKLLSSLRSGRVMIYGEGRKFIQSYFVSGGFVEINPEKCIVLAEEINEMSNLDKNEIETELNQLEHMSDDSSKNKYLVSKARIDALNATHYKNI